MIFFLKLDDLLGIIKRKLKKNGKVVVVVCREHEKKCELIINKINKQIKINNLYFSNYSHIQHK